MHKPKAIGIGLASLLFIILIGVAWQVTAQDETLPFDETVSNELNNNQANRWIFEANRNDILQFDLERLTGNLAPTLIVRNRNNETQLQLNAASDGKISAFVYRVPEFGEYTLEITPQNNTSGRYELLVARLEVGLREFEQGRIAYGQTVTQKITDDIPYHLWSFTGREGEVIDLRMVATDGDLNPVIALVSPGGDVIASQNLAVTREDDKLETRLLAFRLPGNGTYRISARRSGENLGFSGNTAGDYELTLTLRNGTEATSNILRQGDAVTGRLTLDSPVALYEIIDPRTYFVQVEFSEPNCLVDLAITDRGIAVLEAHQGRSPFIYALQIPTVVQPILELKSSHCPNPERIDYQIRLIPTSIELPTNYLPPFTEVYSQGQTESDRWFFNAKQGDVIQLNAQPDQLKVGTNIRLLNANRQTVYRGRLFPNFSDQIWLEEEGIYFVEVESQGTAYHLSYHLIGDNESLYQLQDPIATEFIDIDEPSLWQIIADNRGFTSLVVEAPTGEILATARSTQLNNAVLDGVYLPQAGRYTIKVFSVTRPSEIRTLPINRDRLGFGTSVKGTLTSPLARDVWLVPTSPDTLFDLKLETLTSNLTSFPEVVVLDQSGVAINPEFDSTSRSETNLYRLTSLNGGTYQILVSRNRELSFTDYRLSLESDAEVSSPATTSIPAPQGFENSNFQSTAQPFWLAPPLDASNIAAFENATRLTLPSENRIEILPEQQVFIGRFNIQRNQMLTIEALQLDGETPPGITLLDEDRQIVSERWEREEISNLLFYRTPRAGIYYIALTGDPAGKRYLLSLKTTPNINEQVPDVLEYLPLQLGETYSGSFDTRQETTTYAFWGTQGTEIAVQTIHEVGELAPNLEIITPSQRQLVNQEFDPETLGILTNALRLPETGLYQLKLTATSVDRDLSYSRYRLHTYLIKGDLVTEGLLTDSIVSSLGLEKQSATWLFQGNINELINLKVEPLTNGPSPLSLIISDTDGETIYQRNTSLSVNEIEIRQLLLPKNGIYRVTVQGGTEIGGMYRLSLERNGSFLAETDYPIGYGQSRHRTLTPENRLDRWILAGNQGDVVAVSLRYERGDNIQMGFQIESETGELLYSSSSSDGSGARGDNILLPHTGIYWITVGALDAEATGYTVYNLSAELQNQIRRQNTNGLLQYGQTHEGIIFADNPSNYWVILGEAGKTINLTVSGDGQFEPSFELRPLNSPDVIARAGTLSEAATLNQYTLPSTDTYVLRVSGLDNRTGHYRITVEQIILPTPISELLRAGENYTASLQPGEAKIWELVGQAGEEIQFDLQIPRRSSLEPQVTFYAPDGKPLWTTSTSQKILSIPPYVLPVSGTYRLEITSILGAQAIPNNSEYTLTVQQINPPPSRFIRTLEYNSTGINEITLDSLSNLWSFEGQTGDAITLQGIRTNGDVDLNLRLISPSGELLATDDDSLGNLDAQIQTILPEDGTYLVEISTLRDHLDELDNNYRLELRLDYRPVETVTDQQIIQYGQRLIGSFDPISENSSETVEWAFSGQTGDHIEAVAQFPANDSPLRLFLTDGAGQIYLQGERVDDRILIRDFTLPADGLYNLRLERSLDSLDTSYYPYSLTLNLLGAELQTFESKFIQAGSSETVRITGESAQTWFYAGQAEENIRISLNQITGQNGLRLLVLSPTNQVLINEDLDQPSPLFSVSLPYEGIYQIVVQNLQDNPADYQVHLTSQAFETLVARQLISDLVDKGQLSPQIPQEDWVFEGEAGTGVFIQLQADPDPLIGNIQLKDSVGVVRAYGQADPIRPGHWTLYATLPNNDTYTLSISQSPTLTTGTYRILLTPDAISPEFITASPLSRYEWQLGSLSGSEQGLHSFWGEANTPVSISTRSDDESANISLELQNAKGETLQLGNGEIIDFFPPADGYYLILTAHPTPLRYEIIQAPRPNEHPNAEASIIGLRPQVNLSSTLSPEFPSQLWSLDGDSGQTILIQLEDFSLTLRHDVILFDPEGFPIATALENPTDNKVSLGPILLPLDGIYTVRVGAWLGQTNRSASQYILRFDPVTDQLGSDGGEIHVLGQGVWGGLNSADPNDMWTFRGIVGTKVNLRLDNGIAAIAGLDIELISPDGTRLDVSDYSSLSAEALIIQDFFLPMTGNYTVNVKLDDSSEIEDPLIYRLVVSEARPPIREWLASAKTLIPETPQTDSFETPQRAWVFYANAGETFSLATESETSLYILVLDLQGNPIYGSYTGQIEPTLFNQNGFYGIIVESIDPAITDYSITLNHDTLRPKWRWTLHPDEPIRAILSLGAPIHEWTLTGQTAGEYQIILRPTQNITDLKVYLQDQNGEVLAFGQERDDGVTVVMAYLPDSSVATYDLIVTSEQKNLPSAYDIEFVVANNADSPANIFIDQAQSGQITPLDTTDEWIWRSESQTLLTLHLQRTEGDAALGLRIYAPGNLLLSEYYVEIDEVVEIKDLLIPVEGTYIIQVIRADDITSATQASYVLELSENGAE